MKINYEEQAEFYEGTRGVESLVYSGLCHLLIPFNGEAVLDFGCGTGNYLHQFVLDFGIEPYGVEPSVHMRMIAQKKIQPDRIQAGDDTRLPSFGCLFNKIYITDVIHHIRQLDTLFTILKQGAANGAKLCICTESPCQLGEKYWIKYFPDILEADLQRFHTIEAIIKAGVQAGWVHRETLIIEDERIEPISHNFMKRVEQKTLSAFHLISESAYIHGRALMEADYQAQVLLHQREGYTFVLFERQD